MRLRIGQKLKALFSAGVVLALMAGCHGNKMTYPERKTTTPAPPEQTQPESPQQPSSPTLPEPTPAPEQNGSLPVSASEFHKPVGIYVSSGPVVSDRILEQAHVGGNLIRVGWDDIQKAPGQFDFSAVDTLIQQARSHGKQVALSVLNGPRTPSWLYSQGAKAFSYTFRNKYSERGDREEKIPLPWDKTYLDYWSKLIDALGKEYANNPAIALVHITHSSKNGFEMQLPEERQRGQVETAAQGPWHDAGYSEDKHIEALKMIVDQFANAFPASAIDIEIHPVLNSLAPAQQIFDYGKAKYGDRFGLFSAWWSGKHQQWNEQMYPLFADACQQTFCTVQMIGNQTRQPDRLMNGSLIGAMEAARELGARYFEVWSADLNNTALTRDIASFNDSLQER